MQTGIQTNMKKQNVCTIPNGQEQCMKYVLNFNMQITVYDVTYI